MRCALIEFNSYHEEILPTFVRLLNDLDVEPDVYMVRPSRRRRPFALARDLRFRERRVEGIDRHLGLPFRSRRYQLLIINSMEPVANLERLAGSRTPILGVVHNTELLDEPAYRAFFDRPRRRALVLGSHIARRLSAGGTHIEWILHVEFGRPESAPANAVTTFAVSGNVEFQRRNYQALIAAVAELHAAGAPFKVRIVGRSTRPDGLALREEIERHGLGERFELSPEVLDHPGFYGLVAGSDFMLPLLDGSADSFRRYFDAKLASSVPFAVGLGVPLVLHRELAEAYGVTACGVRYEDGGLVEAMRTAIASTDAERAGWRSAIAATRTEILDASRVNLRRAIEAARA